MSIGGPDMVRTSKGPIVDETRTFFRPACFGPALVNNVYKYRRVFYDSKYYRYVPTGRFAGLSKAQVVRGCIRRAEGNDRETCFRNRFGPSPGVYVL